MAKNSNSTKKTEKLTKNKKNTSNKQKLSTFAIILLAIIGISSIFLTKKTESVNQKEVITFYSPSCKHCKYAIEFIKSIQDDYKDITFTQINANTPRGAKRYKHYADLLNIETQAVPLTVFGTTNYSLGWNPSKSKDAYTQYINNIQKEEN